MRPLDPRKKEIIAAFLGTITRGLTETQTEIIKTGVRILDQEALASSLDSLNHTIDPQQKAEIFRGIYAGGLGGTLKLAIPDDESRRQVINGAVGAEIAHPRKRVEG